MYRLRLKCRMARESKTMKAAKAAFSKSVSWTSIGRNSTRQPMGELTGGGLKRSVCQLVDWMFCESIRNKASGNRDNYHTSKWSLLFLSSWWIVSEKITRGSRMNRCAMCLDSKSSTPAEKISVVIPYSVFCPIAYHAGADVRRWRGRGVLLCHYMRGGSSNTLKYTS